MIKIDTERDLDTAAPAAFQQRVRTFAAAVLEATTPCNGVNYCVRCGVPFVWTGSGYEANRLHRDTCPFALALLELGLAERVP